MTTLAGRPRSALLVIDVQQGVVAGAPRRDAVVANIAGLDLAASIEAKMEANAAKYPVEKARGSSAKYTEL